MDKVAMVLMDGVEEIEAIAVIDILRRADISVSTYSVGDKKVRGSHGIIFEADKLISEAAHENFKMIVLPGGPGVEHLKKDPRVGDLLERHTGKDKYVAAICAAPTVLGEFGMLKGRAVTGYPGTEERLQKAGAIVTLGKVVIDENLITGRGAGTALEFALELVTALKGSAKSEWLREKLAM